MFTQIKAQDTSVETTELSTFFDKEVPRQRLLGCRLQTPPQKNCRLNWSNLHLRTPTGGVNAS
jgi:hypothetical protein